MTDLIDRQMVMEVLNAIYINRPLDSDRWVIGDITNQIKDLPSAEPERKTGKWITEECLPGVAVCSICGHEIRGIGCQYTKYCDECGARMDEE